MQNLAHSLSSLLLRPLYQGMGMYAYNPSKGEEEAEGFQV